MHRVRGMLPVLIGVACAAAIGVTASAGGAQATGATTAGVTYGGLTPQDEHLWFRLRRDRRAIVSHEVEWYVPTQRCSNGEEFFSYTALGSDHGRPMPVRNERFTRTAVDRYSRNDVAIVEQYRIVGSITPAAITGQITVNITAKRPDGSGYTCTLGPLRYRAVN